MDECPHYRIRRKSLESRVIRADRQRSLQVIQIPWCAHPNHSPVDEALATGVIGGANLLKCGGEVAKCHLSPEQFADIE